MRNLCQLLTPWTRHEEPTYVNQSSLNFFRFFFNCLGFCILLWQSCSPSYLYLQFKIWFINSYISIQTHPCVSNVILPGGFLFLLVFFIYFGNKKLSDHQLYLSLILLSESNLLPLKSNKTLRMLILKGTRGYITFRILPNIGNAGNTVCACVINPFAPGDFAKKHVLKLVEWFSSHCRALKS